MRVRVSDMVSVGVSLAFLVLFQLAVEAGEWKSYLESNGMPCQEVSAMALDGDVLWVGTFGKSGTDGCELLSLKIETEEWESYSLDIFRNRTIFSICVDHNKVWFGTDSGFVSLTKPSAVWKVYPPSIGLPGEEVRDIAIRGDELWLAVYRKQGYESIGCGLTRFMMKKVECKTFTEQDGLPSNTIRFIDVRDGLVWIGTEKGLINFNPEYEQFALYFRGGNIDEDVMSMAPGEETYWFGTEDFTYSYSVSKGTWTEHDFGPTLVSHMLLTNKRLWVAPMIGLSSYDIKTEEWTEHSSRFLSETALSGLNVKALCATRDYLFVGTADGGLSRYTFHGGEIPVAAGIDSVRKTYPKLKEGHETPMALMKTLVQFVQAGQSEKMMSCLTFPTQHMLTEAAAERGKTPLDLFRRWFEGVDSDNIPERVIRSVHRELRDILVDDRWLLDKKPEERNDEEIQEMKPTD